MRKILAIVLIFSALLLTTSCLSQKSNPAVSNGDNNSLEGISNGIVLFKLEDYSLDNNKVVLEGKLCGAFLAWTPEDDYTTSMNEAATFTVSNEVHFDYYEKYASYATPEVSNGSAGRYFRDVYENAAVQAEYVYIHIHDGMVVYMQQTLAVCY